MARAFQVAGSSSLLWGQVCALWRSFFLPGLAGDALLILKRERKKGKKPNVIQRRRKGYVLHSTKGVPAEQMQSCCLKEPPKKRKKLFLIKTREGKKGVSKHAVLGKASKL